jgi:hypothetical protein
MEYGILGKQERIIVIGDLHADYQKLLYIFKSKLKLLDQNNKWIGKNTVVVQLGDQVDGGGRHPNCRTNGELQIIKFLDYVDNEAKKYGGGVYSLIGNHEMMNMLGNYSYTSPIDRIEKHTYFKIGTPFAKKFANSRYAILKIGSVLFVHGGILPQHFIGFTNSALFIKYLNELMKKLFYGNIDKTNNNVKKFFLDSQSPLWNRKLGQKNILPQTKIDIDKVLAFFNVNHIVIGHSIQEKQINSVYNNKVWRVDAGMSAAFCSHKNKAPVLEIINNGDTFNIL